MKSHVQTTSPLLHEAQPSTSSTLINDNELEQPLPTLPPFSQPTSKKHWIPDPSVEGPKGRARTLVLCFDGTGDQFNDDNSNVVHFVRCLKKDDQRYQVVYYQTGIGTYSKDKSVTPLTNKMNMLLDEMFAWNLSAHVQDGYEFLMQNYTAGDKIAILGFSRGAYTARALAGMVQKVGLLPACNTQQIPFAWAMYTRVDKDGLNNSSGFKETFCIDVTIDFVGVWETVASVGVLDKELPFVATNSAIRIFRHALSLDEHRAKFMPNFYHASPDSEPTVAESSISAISKSFIQSELSATEAFAIAKRSERQEPSVSTGQHRSSFQAWEEEVNASTDIKTDVKEVWFAGCHCDIGGGSVRNRTPHSLARIPLRWMIRECFETNTGIIFDGNALKKLGLDPETLYPVVKHRPPRIPPQRGDFIREAPRQELTIVTVAKVAIEIAAIPLKLLFNICIFPFKQVWLTLKFSPPFKKLGELFGTGKRQGGRPKTTHKPPQTFESEEVEELRDALSPIYDQLKLHWFWWIVEILPLRHREQVGKRDDFYVTANFGRGRLLYGDALAQGLKIHRSVKTRLEILDKTGGSVYCPNARMIVKDSVGKTNVGHSQWNVDKPDEWEWVD